MNQANTLDAANPYSAPGAQLNQGSDELYTPSILSFSGRIGRLRYLAYGMGSYLLLMLVMVPLAGTSAIIGGDPGSMSGIAMLVMAVAYIAMLVVGVGFAKRRLNDLDRSGWWMLLIFVPIVNLLLTIYMLFFPGTDGSNNWGPAPVANSLGVLILGWMMPVLVVVGIVAAVAIPQFVGMPQS
jgi:uncharacterized membrane protein YhaH (DUF805 family)